MTKHWFFMILSCLNIMLTSFLIHDDIENYVGRSKFYATNTRMMIPRPTPEPPLPPG